MLDPLVPRLEFYQARVTCRHLSFAISVLKRVLVFSLCARKPRIACDSFLTPPYLPRESGREQGEKRRGVNADQPTGAIFKKWLDASASPLFLTYLGYCST